MQIILDKKLRTENLGTFTSFADFAPLSIESLYLRGGRGVGNTGTSEDTKASVKSAFKHQAAHRGRQRTATEVAACSKAPTKPSTLRQH
ncbi:hypothetical protein CC1G_02905 [Coprinopsis cinerea okayama7|uniref:Uncharacterized protein n=1 Tax=Coprinopsis cinerea (strain Okayama-7 / 130 / ATCC MYA-4618 / FGSC 9003) TaxID=240176 RepID=A8NRN6_COPC7|nr:hypothetical protein CC1G_02905 [Coprinopsis cinerea okayama7\|eukprot:XP_001835817.2 hypothetical protein CC1G_02905 [Coprinopsis cinerea okayama7\